MFKYNLGDEVISITSLLNLANPHNPKKTLQVEIVTSANQNYFSCDPDTRISDITAVDTSHVFFQSNGRALRGSRKYLHLERDRIEIMTIINNACDAELKKDRLIADLKIKQAQREVEKLSIKSEMEDFINESRKLIMRMVLTG